MDLIRTFKMPSGNEFGQLECIHDVSFFHDSASSIIYHLFSEGLKNSMTFVNLTFLCVS